MLDNKWRHGKTKLILPPLPEEILLSPGIKLMPCVLDAKVGEEMVLLITEPEELAKEYEGLKSMSFFSKSGLANTSFGPVYWILFYSPNTNTGQMAIYENIINPKNRNQMNKFKQLAEQKYWHVVIANEVGRVVNFFEFENIYGLSDALKQVDNVCAKMVVTDFMAAKAEYEMKYSAEELLEL